MKELIDLFKQFGIEPIIVRIPTESKPDDARELLAYNRVNNIVEHSANELKWNLVIQYLTEDVLYIANCIKSGKVYHKDKLEQFTKNCCTIMSYWDEVYRDAFNSIKEFRDRKDKGSDLDIDKMNEQQLREYIKKNINK